MCGVTKQVKGESVFPWKTVRLYYIIAAYEETIKMERNNEVAKNGYQMIKKHKKNNDDILPSEIFKRATDFAKAFERCIKIENGDMLFVPAYSNLALSFELCLKAIAKQEQNTIPSGHDLSLLFSQLDESTKQAIIQDFNYYFKISFGKNLSEASFYSNLKQIATTFHDYRYEYEWGTGKGFMINDGFLRCLGAALFVYAARVINVK